MAIPFALVTGDAAPSSNGDGKFGALPLRGPTALHLADRGQQKTARADDRSRTPRTPSFGAGPGIISRQAVRGECHLLTINIIQFPCAGKLCTRRPDVFGRHAAIDDRAAIKESNKRNSGAAASVVPKIPEAVLRRLS
jgi:hypothetical protein